MTNTVEHIALLMAMSDEAAPLIGTLEMTENCKVFNPHLPMRCFQSKPGSQRVSLVVAGRDNRHGVDHIGSEASTLMAYEAITRLGPDLLISAGTAGGFSSRGAEVGTVYLSDRHFVFHDRHVPLPGFRESAIGAYPALPIRSLARSLGLPAGVVSTGSSLEKSERDVRVIDGHGAVAKEMEAAAIAWVAMLFDIPVMAVKSITNLVDLDNASETEFATNLEFASRRLHDEVLRVLQYLRGKSLNDLA